MHRREEPRNFNPFVETFRETPHFSTTGPSSENNASSGVTSSSVMPIISNGRTAGGGGGASMISGKKTTGKSSSGGNNHRPPSSNGTTRAHGMEDARRSYDHPTTSSSAYTGRTSPPQSVLGTHSTNITPSAPADAMMDSGNSSRNRTRASPPHSSSRNGTRSHHHSSHHQHHRHRHHPQEEEEGDKPITTMPDLYRAALSHRWAEVISRSFTNPSEARYIHPADGSTALHIAVISRVSHSNCSTASLMTRGRGGGGATSGAASSATTQQLKQRTQQLRSAGREGGDVRGGHDRMEGGTTTTRTRGRSGDVRDTWGTCDRPAPSDAIRALLIAYPDAALVRCRHHGYTPLAYACLVPPPSLIPPMNGRSDLHRHHHDDNDNNSNEDDALNEAENIVRLFLEHRKGCASILTKSGLTPLDVHIVSYSQSRGDDEEAEGIGRTTTGVLRALLEADPSLARSRPLLPLKPSRLRRRRRRRHGGHHQRGDPTATTTEGDRYDDDDYENGNHNETEDEDEDEDEDGLMSVGPLELLYRCNAQAFVQAVAREDEKHPPRQRRKKAWYEDYTPAPEKSSTHTVTLSSWWVWKWTILLLKYGILHQKKRGARFKAVHAAASVVGCPLPLLMLTVRAFPSQVREPGEMIGQEGNLPLHLVASWGGIGNAVNSRRQRRRRSGSKTRHRRRSNSGGGGGGADNDDSFESVTRSRKGMAISALLSEYPEAAKIQNGEGKTPLWIALESGTTWDCGIRKLVRAYPDAVCVRANGGGTTNYLYPFMIAAVAAAGTESNENEDDADGVSDEKKRLTSTYYMSLDGKKKKQRSEQKRQEQRSKRELMHIWTIYELLRVDPTVVGRCLDEQNGDWAHFDELPSTMPTTAIAMMVENTFDENWADFAK